MSYNVKVNCILFPHLAISDRPSFPSPFRSNILSYKGENGSVSMFTQSGNPELASNFFFWINISYCCTTFPTTMGRGQLRHSIIQLACLGIIQVCVSGLKEWTYVSTAGVQTTRGVNACTTHSSMVANSSRILR